MSVRVKLVWKFFGVDSSRTAEHHLQHLNEYIQKEDIDVLERSTQLINDVSAISYIIVLDEFVEKLRRDLKPHQGFLEE